VQTILDLQRTAGNRAVAGSLAATAIGRLPGVPPYLQRKTSYDPGESDAATAHGVISPDVRLLGGTGSGYNASGDSVLIADFRPNSAVVRTSATEELRKSWARIIEGGASLPYAVLGFADATGAEGGNETLRAARAQSVAAMLPGTAKRGVVGAAPIGDFIMPGNSTPEQRALNRAVLVRLPPDELRQQHQVDRYSGDAVTFWSGNPGKTVADLLTFVSGQANAQLERNGVLPPDVVPGTTVKGTGTLAYFSPVDWQITVDAAALATASPQAGVTAASLLSGLSVDAVAHLSMACYHEARHAEQDFLAARLTAEEGGRSLDARTLGRRLGIHIDAAQAAISASTQVLPDVLKAKAGAWRTFMKGGRHIPYREWNEGLKGYLAIFSFIFGPKMNEYASKGAADIQALWQHGLHVTLDEKLRRRYYAQVDDLLRPLVRDPRPEAVDVEVRQRMQATTSAVHAALILERHGATLPDRAALAAMGPDDVKMADLVAQEWILKLYLALLDARDAADAAYRAYPHEADAYETGDLVTASVKAKGAP